MASPAIKNGVKFYWKLTKNLFSQKATAEPFSAVTFYGKPPAQYFTALAASSIYSNTQTLSKYIW